MKSILRYCVRVQNNRLNNQPNNITISESLYIELATNYLTKTLTAHLSMNNAVWHSLIRLTDLVTKLMASNNKSKYSFQTTYDITWIKRLFSAITLYYVILSIVEYKGIYMASFSMLLLKIYINVLLKSHNFDFVPF